MPIATKVVCFSRLLKCLRNLYGKSVDPDQTAPIGAVCSGSTLFASILTSSVIFQRADKANVPFIIESPVQSRAIIDKNVIV